MTSHLLRRSFSAGGGAAAASVTVASWFGEQSTSKASSRLCSSLQQQQQQYSIRRCFSGLRRRKKFNTRSSSTVSTKTDSTAEISSSTPPPPPTTTKKSLSFMEWYEGHLERTPVITKMVTGSILWGVGDAVAQLVPQVAAGMQKDSSPSLGEDSKLTPTPSSLTTSLSNIKYDWPRTGRAVFFGFALHAPTSHVHFNFLEWMTVKAGFTGLSIPIFKTVMEQFVYWSWISNSMYHGAMGLMQGQTPAEAMKRIEDLLWDTQKAQWAFWIPVQLLNFRFVPVRHQLNVVLLTSIFWTALLSAWYPPVEDKEEGESTPVKEEGDHSGDVNQDDNNDNDKQKTIT